MNDPGPHDVGGGEDHPLTGIVDRWEAVIDDMEATAAEYREAGWTVVELHPGDVTPLPPAKDGEAVDDSRIGLDVLVPDNEFEQVEAEASSVVFDSYDAYRAQAGSVLFAVAAIEAQSTETAVLVPLYYRTSESTAMSEKALERGRLDIFVRPLSDDRRVVFRQDNPALLLPESTEE